MTGVNFSHLMFWKWGNCVEQSKISLFFGQPFFYKKYVSYELV